MPLVDKDAKVCTMNYRSAVGPPDLYDVIGELQFHIMVEEGLREWHTFLDIGCGSLRGGRFFMVYLQSNRYFGIEPQQQLVYDGIQANLGESIWAVKKPEFHYSGDFDLSHFGVQFNYILAQSIFSHAAPHMINKCLSEIQKVLKPNGTFIATYFKGTTNYGGTTWAQAPDARYTKQWLNDMCSSHGLTLQTLSHAHPSDQTWVRIRRK